ncbi:hypothetical protein BDZ91DRAFT_646425, partial [Kalaharituber pfeilii]
VSHAWVADTELDYTITHVNHCLWPVPIPRGITIENIREQLLMYNIRYSWLDVLCLRQVAAPRPDMRLQVDAGTLAARERCRLDEWAKDVPLIGETYRQASRIVVYLSGLGKQFHAGGWDHER